MDNNIGGSTPTSLTSSCPFANITNASAGDSRKKCNNIGGSTPTSLTRSSPFADVTNASAVDSRINHDSDRCTSSNLPQKENMQNLQEDGANLNALELRRKRARKRYASMSPKKKEARKMKARVYKQRKEESLGLNQNANNYVKENEPIQSIVTPHRVLFNETAVASHAITSKMSTPVASSFSDPAIISPLGDITNVSADDLRSCHVNDCLTLQQRSNHALLQSADTTGPGSVAHRPMITPRRLPFTVINNVAHYDNMEHTGSPFSCILQETTQTSQATTLLPANTDKFVVFT